MQFNVYRDKILINFIIIKLFIKFINIFIFNFFWHVLWFMAFKDNIMVIILGIIKVMGDIAKDFAMDIMDITRDTKDSIKSFDKALEAIIKDLVNSIIPRFF